MHILPNSLPSVQLDPAVPPQGLPPSRPPRTPGIRMAQAQRLLQVHAWLLATQGRALYFVHRQEVGRPANFLQSVRRLLRDLGTAQWAQPWPRGACSNVLLVTVAALGQPLYSRAECEPRDHGHCWSVAGRLRSEGEPC